MELYTSLTRLKMEMNDGALPPMTPVPLNVQKYIDPAFTIGMGALTEDKAKGLRCPVRRCGVWTHTLTHHLNRDHGGIGGAEAIRALLGIPSSVALISTRLRRSFTGRQGNSGSYSAGRVRSRASYERSAATLAASKTSVHSRNLRDRCDAQLSHRLVDLEHKLGRSPGVKDAKREYGAGFVKAVERNYGSWNSAKAQCGLSVHVKGHTPEDIYEAYGEYHKAHGRLPSADEAAAPDRTPLVPCYSTVLRALATRSWPLAMSEVAFVLGIEDPRYSVVAA